MAVSQPPGAQITNDGAVIRIEKNGKILLVAKDQVKTIDIVHANIVRIDIGEGPLKNIFLNYQEVASPAVASANELRRSEEHTSELQSQFHLVCRLLLEK